MVNGGVEVAYYAACANNGFATAAVNADYLTRVAAILYDVQSARGGCNGRSPAHNTACGAYSLDLAVVVAVVDYDVVLGVHGGGTRGIGA